MIVKQCFASFVCLQLLSSLLYLLNSNLDISSLVRRFNFDDVYNNPDKSESDPVSDIKNSHNNYTEIASPRAHGPVCLWRSYSGSTIKNKLFHNKTSAGHLNTAVNLEASGLPLEWELDTNRTGANMIFFLLAWAENCAAGFLRWTKYLLSPCTCVYMATSTYTLHYEVGFLTEKKAVDINARPQAGNVCLWQALGVLNHKDAPIL